MNHRHRKVLHSLFGHPISANIDPGQVEAVFRELGAEVKSSGTGKLSVHLNGHTASFPVSHGTLPKDEVVQMRKFLIDCGVDPTRDYPV